MYNHTLDHARHAKNMPKSVPILQASDFCKGDYKSSDNNNKQLCCMIGWFREAFCHEEDALEDALKDNPIILDDYHDARIQTGISTKIKYRSWRAHALQTLVKECKRTESKVKSGRKEFINKKAFYDNEDIVMFNDIKTRKLNTLARVWNKTMAHLGYTEENPEAK